MKRFSGIFLSITLLSLVISACASDETATRKWISHRGVDLNHTIAGENSLEAVAYARMVGFDCIETDVRTTSDGILVCMHDETINRTCLNKDGSEIQEKTRVCDLTFDELYDIYHEQAEAMEEAGVDMYVIETIMTVPDARAALLAVKDVSDKPVLVSFTCDENGRTLTGTDVCAALVIMQGMGIDAFGLNCSTGPEEMLAQFKRLGEFAEVPLAVKPNAGLPEVVDGKTVYSCTPEELASYTDRFNGAGAAMFGGCCGTGPDHIAALKGSLGGFSLKKPCPQHTDRNQVVCATEKDAFVLDMDAAGGISADTVLSCDADLETKIKKENRGDADVIAIEIAKDADLDEFGAAQYAIRKPLCIACEDAKLLEEALRLYQGRAIYAGSLSTDELGPMVRKYGLII